MRKRRYRKPIKLKTNQFWGRKSGVKMKDGTYAFLVKQWRKGA